ncbi:MAG: SDR family NAD(P)-dependent oxidoreductase [Stagnimonas sp.]|nr:SDR family NAD(P)-dependent oxidoreductase [Stagnimonas sp.]
MAAAQTLAGRVALVTGASRGIGRAIALRLAAHGAAVALTASPRSREGLEASRVAIEGLGGRAALFTADLADAEARSTLVAQAEAALGPVDILVNNAAAIPAYAPPSKMPLAARQTLFEINLQAPIDLIQQALPGMRARGWGRILNLSSDMTRQPPIPYPGPAKFVHMLALYGASKAALDRYTLGLAAELHGSGIHVNSLLPYKIARSESAEDIARQTFAAHPDWIESVELMAEAAYLLIAGRHSGEIAVSRELLARAQQPLHALDGETVIGDALSLVTFEN